MTENFDCVVIGAGPAGCTAATLVAEAGHKTLLVEREKVPRFHVGESLMPETYWTLERLGVLEQMKERGFVPKSGVQFVSHSGKESQPFFFREHDDRESSTTWHVERDRFDEMLFDNAAEKGADCRDETRVSDLQLSENGPHRIRIRTGRDEPRHVEARVIIDGSGQSAMIASRLKLREYNRRLQKASIWTYFRGAERCSEAERMTTMILHTNDKKAWFWYIPLSNDIVSVGVVGNNDYLLKNRGKPDEIFCDEIGKCDSVARRIVGSQHEGRYHVAKEFSYWSHQQSGPGWVLIGDAFGFIDPVYSSGVYLALKSGELAADAVVEGFRKNDLSAKQLGSWAEDFKKGAQWIRKLVHAFYTDEFSFGEFMKSHPEHQGNLTDLLIGRVWHEGVGKIFDDMDSALDQSSAEGRMASK